ncbi:30S ribosomal protein S8 [Candidatus Dojkabacteria bacterium]|nr:30S ribosomal protein S8 [Candidatus Dojkabacteria bacterium]
MVNDPIGDALTRIRNAYLRGHNQVSIPYSKMISAIVKILEEENYIQDYEITENDKGFKVLTIELLYFGKNPGIKSLKRISRPGVRQYVGYKDIPRIIDGMGICILSTTKGVISGKRAKTERIGGELLCSIY